jgi:hypothetical protein
MGVSCITNLHSHSAAVIVEFAERLPSDLSGPTAVSSDESHDGPLPNDCDVDPRVVNHLLCGAHFDLGLVDQLVDYLTKYFVLGVESTL